MATPRCGSCSFLNRSTATDIGGLRIAKCSHPVGVTIETTTIKSDFVALDAHCAEHTVRRRRSARSGGAHA